MVDALGLGGWREGGEPTQGSPTLLHDASRLRPVAARRERAHKGPIAGFAHRVELDELPRLCARVVGAVSVRRAPTQGDEQPSYRPVSAADASRVHLEAGDAVQTGSASEALLVRDETRLRRRAFGAA